MKKLAVLLAVTMVFVLGLAQAVSAGWGGGSCGIGGPPPQLSADKWQNQAAFLGLTDEQSARIKAVRQEHFNTTRDLRAKLQNSYFELRQLSWEKSPDPGKISKKINEVNTLRSELYKQSQKCLEQINSVLTPEQQAKLAQQRTGRTGGKGQGVWGGMYVP
ncbi:MAG: Spy/CpxP family protein refolding chaperone [Bacillota bacterium]